MPISMFWVKTERSYACARSATSASATTIEAIASMSGTRPATTAPKTSSRTTSASGAPKKSSPFFRSSSDAASSSASAVRSPVTAAL